MKKRDQYIQAYRRAESNEQHDRDLYDGLPRADQDFFEFLKNGPCIESLAVNDFVDGRFCPPK